MSPCDIKQSKNTDRDKCVHLLRPEPKKPVAVLVAEAIRIAQEATGGGEITPADMRDAYEALGITDERWTELGLPGFAPAFQNSCEDHGAPHMGAMQQWDAKAKKWTLVSDFMEPDYDVVNPLIEEDSMAFAAENNITPRTCE